MLVSQTAGVAKEVCCSNSWGRQADMLVVKWLVIQLGYLFVSLGR